MSNLVSEAAQAADKEPRVVRLSLRPQDARLVTGYELGETVKLAVSGEITDLSMGEFGSSLTIEIGSLALSRPEPEKFVDQLKEGVKTLTS